MISNAAFSEGQKAHMRELDAMTPEEKCWCGWYRLGECPHCPAGKTCAEKLVTDPYWIERIAKEKERESL